MLGYLDAEEVKELMSRYHRRIFAMQESIVMNMILVAQNEFSDIPAQYVWKEIYSALLIATKTAREIMITKFGGRPKGEAQVRYYEQKLRETTLKNLEIGDFDILTED